MKLISRVDTASELHKKLNWRDWIFEYGFQIISQRSFDSVRSVYRVKRAVSLSESPDLPTATFPEIEILSVAAGKDIEILFYSMRSALLTSKNPIAQVTVICPSSDVEHCRTEISRIQFQGKVQILDEDSVLNLDRRQQIRANYGNRYGWVLQQFLALEYIINSQFKGVLLLNSDTVILRRTHWLDDLGNQILMVSHEFHKPYYLLLNKVLGLPKNPKYTFITHHMLFQPLKLQAIFLNRGIENTPHFQEVIIRNSDFKQQSPLCVEFEPYGQGMFEDYASYTHLRKFANKSVVRTPENLAKIPDLMEDSAEIKYNSISLHDYL